MHTKTAVSVAIALVGLGGAMVAQAQSKVELWGIVDAAVRHTNNEGKDKGGLTKMVGGGMSQSRWGLNVEEDLGGGSKALAHVEHRFNADTGEKDTATTPFFQLSYVGLQGPYGKLTMGRQWNVLFDVVTSTYASFPYSPYMDAYKPELGMAAGARSSNSLKYTLATPSRNWVGTLQYSFAEGNSTDAIAQGAQDAAATKRASLLAPANLGATAAAAAAASQTVTQYVTSQVTSAVSSYGNANIPAVAAGALKQVGGFLRYSENGISLGGGYLRTSLPGGSDLDAWTLGGSYRSGPLYVNLGYGLNKIKMEKAAAGDIAGQIRNTTDLGVVGAMWSGQTNGGFQPGDANKRQMFKVGFGYQITPQINAGMHYFHAKQSGGASGLYNGKANFMVAAVDYAFSKRTDAYFAVDHTRISGGASMEIDTTSHARTRTGITAGLRHRF
ncbi:MAG: porin [Comamonas sp.]